MPEAAEQKGLIAKLFAGTRMYTAVSPSMLGDAVKAAVKYPNVKILNCSFGKTAASVRCYYGKMYEASFLMGILRQTGCLPNAVRVSTVG